MRLYMPHKGFYPLHLFLPVTSVVFAFDAVMRPLKTRNHFCRQGGYTPAKISIALHMRAQSTLFQLQVQVF